MSDNEDIKTSIKMQRAERHARIDADTQKLEDIIENEKLPPMVRCYIDIMILNIDLLKECEQHAQNHIDDLDEIIDRYTKSTPL